MTDSDLDTGVSERKAPGLTRWLLLLAILAITVAVRLPSLSTFGYGVDEGLTAAEAIRLVDEHDWRFWDIPSEKLYPLSSTMPGSYYVAAIGLETVGRDLFGLRVPFLVLGVLSILLAYLVTVRLTGSHAAGLVAALFLALNPAHIEYSQLARFYLPTQVLCLLLVLTVHRLVSRPTWPRALAVALTLLIGYWTHHLFVLLLPICAIYGLLALVRPPEGAAANYRKRLLLLAGLAILVSLPPLLHNAAEAMSTRYSPTVDTGRTAPQSLRVVTRALGGALLRIELPVLLLSLLGAWQAWRRWGRNGLLLSLLSFGLLAEILCMGSLAQVRGRYVLWCLPYFAILAGVATTWTSRGARPGRAVALITTLVACYLGTFAVEYHRHGNGRVASGRVQAEVERLAHGDRTLILGYAPPREALALAGWNADHTTSIGTSRLHLLDQEIEAWKGERLVMVAHEHTEKEVLRSGLLDRPEMSQVSILIDRTRRGSQYYVFYVWQPQPDPPSRDD